MFIAKITVGSETGLAIEAETTPEADIIRDVLRDGDRGYVTCRESNQHQFPILMIRKEAT